MVPEQALQEGSRVPTILDPAGGVAQLAERYVRNVEAVGSNPITSTRKAQFNGSRIEHWRSQPAIEAPWTDLRWVLHAVAKSPVPAVCNVFLKGQGWQSRKVVHRPRYAYRPYADVPRQLGPLPISAPVICAPTPRYPSNRRR
jgi:hypothetical protein